MKQPKTLTQAIGERIREVRETTGLRQEDVASSARRRFGLQWTQATVASLETGKRQLTVEELILLPLLMSCELGELLPKTDPLLKDEWISLTPQTDVRARVLHYVLNDMAREASRFDIKSADESATSKNTPTFVTKDAELRLRQLTNEAASDAALKAARRLKISPLEIAEGARRLWRRSLTEERDARIAERIRGKEARTVQALRGHVTRALLGELRSMLQSKAKPKKATRR